MVSTANQLSSSLMYYGGDRGRNELESLVLRLEEGDRRILEAKAAGEDTTKMELFWIQLLRQYEATYDEMLQAA
jgi:hypothetical protein